MSRSSLGSSSHEDATQLRKLGVAAVYTPKDFESNRIMMDIVALVDPASKAAE